MKAYFPLFTLLLETRMLFITLLLQLPPFSFFQKSSFPSADHTVCILESKRETTVELTRGQVPCVYFLDQTHSLKVVFHCHVIVRAHLNKIEAMYPKDARKRKS